MLHRFFSHNLAGIVATSVGRHPQDKNKKDQKKKTRKGKAEPGKGQEESAVRLALNCGEAASWWWRAFVASTHSASAYLRRPGRCSTVATLLQNCSPCVKSTGKRRARTDKRPQAGFCAGVAAALSSRPGRQSGAPGCTDRHPEARSTSSPKVASHPNPAPHALRCSCPSRSSKPGAARPARTPPLPFPRRDGVRRCASFHPLARCEADGRGGLEDVSHPSIVVSQVSETDGASHSQRGRLWAPSLSVSHSRPIHPPIPPRPRSSSPSIHPSIHLFPFD